MKIFIGAFTAARFGLVSFLLMLTGCSLVSPLPQVEGSTQRILQTDFFEHLVLLKGLPSVNSAGFSESTKPLVVVIEGDGRPWKSRNVIAIDPTPSNPLMLEWFRQWPGEAVYLGRPCYFGQAARRPPEPVLQIDSRLKTSLCDPYWYTFGRYSQAVVDSMADALLQVTGGRSLVLLGHSGGGTLAMLLAARLADVAGVVTLSGNLSVASWTEYHQYSSLVGSLDPATLPVLSSNIIQLHIAATGDKVILADWIRAESERQGGEYSLLDIDSHNGWQSHWDVLNGRIRGVLQGSQDQKRSDSPLEALSSAKTTIY